MDRRLPLLLRLLLPLTLLLRRLLPLDDDLRASIVTNCETHMHSNTRRLHSGSMEGLAILLVVMDDGQKGNVYY